MHRALRPLLATLLLAGPWACSDDAAGSGSDACRTNVDCELPLQCVEGVCTLECRDTIDCDPGAVCYQGACRSRPNACSIAEDCAPFGEVCDRVRNLCVPPGTARCDDDLAPCPAGERCVQGLCQLPTDDMGRPPNPDQGPRPDQGGPDPDMRTPDPDMRTPDPDMRVPDPDMRAPDPDMGGDDCPALGNQPYGQPCVRGTDCASGFCVENKVRGQRLCTSRCNLDAANPAATCPDIDVCVGAEVQPPARPDCPGPELPPAGTIVGVCVGNETGLPCDFENARPGECIGGACLQPIRADLNPYPWTHPQAICAAACVDGARCPAGFVCGDVGNQRLCVPAVTQIARCDGGIDFCGGVCPGVPPEREAEVAQCLTVPGRPGGYCSCSCQSQRDCPQGFSCSPFGPDNKVCIPFAGLRCPEEDPNPLGCQRDGQCGPGEVCLGGLCQYLQCPSLTCAIDDEDPRLNLCLAGCANDFDCPGDHQCQQFPGVGGFCTPRAR
ncbi:MAG: hypothetical protein KC613_09370 [Myxococcales bacterium]|nr:hypothetical protein [Myxococcales bacterium]MCB9522394.1 hypothetical protein [Myxococcales bacterium]